jgi:hypothetical protein
VARRELRILPAADVLDQLLGVFGLFKAAGCIVGKAPAVGPLATLGQAAQLVVGVAAVKQFGAAALPTVALPTVALPEARRAPLPNCAYAIMEHHYHSPHHSP